jgi:hypothetical protein
LLFFCHLFPKLGRSKYCLGNPVLDGEDSKAAPGIRKLHLPS